MGADERTGRSVIDREPDETMADVFFSYQRGDRARVEPIVRLLEQAGFSVWWDSGLVAGEEFRAVISRELHAAGSVVVAWSAASIGSGWVYDEASVGHERGVLVPFTLDGTPPPIGFRTYQTPDLRGWRGDPDDPPARQLVGGAAHAVGKKAQRPPPKASRLSPRVLVPVAALVAAAVVAALLAVVRPDPAYTVGSIPLPGNATSMTHSPDGRHGYVLHSSTGTISVIDLTTHEIVRTIDDVGTGALAVAVSPDGRTGYVSHYTATQVSVVDLATGTQVSSIDVGAAQWDVKLGPGGRHAYVTDRGSGLLTLIDTVTRSVIANIPTSDDPSDSPVGVALTRDGRRAYVTNRSSGTVAVVDTERHVLVATITLQQGPNGVAVSPDDRYAYVTNEGASSVSVLDLADDTVAATIRVGIAPITVAFTPDGKRALVVNRGSRTVSVIDTATRGVLRTVPIGSDPGSITVSPDGGTAFVTGGDSDVVITVAL
jgi:YVTN family beta-propeller protein